ncbi:MAG: type II toxin-antitoxin system PemK/MazF family toxin [Chloroflexota bacterium]
MKEVNQGEIYWIDGRDIKSGELGIHLHPYVVVQDDLLNHSRLDTVVVCALTTNLKQANAYGNVRLDASEANLEKDSVVVVSKLSSVSKEQLGEKIGRLSSERIEEIFSGMRLLNQSFRR